MYKVCIPIISKDYSEKQKDLLIKELKRAKPDIIFLVFYRIITNNEQLQSQTEMFVKNKKFFEDNGFKVGAWLAPTIGYGSAGWYDFDAADKLVRIHSVDGKLANGAYCPLDDNFVSEFINTITTLAKTGVKDILFEDDYTLSGGKAIMLGCCCDKHMKLYCEKLGENIEREQLYEKILIGGKNKYRDTWLELMGETLCDFSAKIEKAVHAIDKDIRIGLSANASSHTMEGVELSKLARIIAGDNKPFIRMTGAPYWRDTTMLSTSIEAIRVQTEWCKDGIELLTEGDTYPRPRLWVPSSYLECYDMILRADGKSDGILKYMIDYTYNADYETGYVDNHARNQKVYEEIERRFSDKETVGINVFENTLLFERENLKNDEEVNNYIYSGKLPLAGQWLLCDNSIPTTYGRKDCASLVFGANAYYADDEILKNGAILDAEAAIILTQKGVDVGIKDYKETTTPAYEHYVEVDEYAPIVLGKTGRFYDFDIDDDAEILSEFLTGGQQGFVVEDLELVKNNRKIPACYYYENANHQRFVVYSFVPKTVTVTSEWTTGMFRNYYRQRQIADGARKVQGRPLPAMCYKHPRLYMLCKKNENSMTIGLWNLFEDTVFSPEIELDGGYKMADFYNCGGSLHSDKLKLETDIAPYGFAFVTLYK